jgi:hypothetical protein
MAAACPLQLLSRGGYVNAQLRAEVQGGQPEQLWKLLSATELRKQCRLLVPFLFGEANPKPNLKPTWLAIIAGRARPDEPEVVGGVQEEGW